MQQRPWLACRPPRRCAQSASDTFLAALGYWVDKAIPLGLAIGMQSLQLEFWELSRKLAPQPGLAQQCRCLEPAFLGFVQQHAMPEGTVRAHNNFQERLQSALQLTFPGCTVVVDGSTTLGTAVAGSDIDLVVETLAPATNKKRKKALQEAEEELTREYGEGNVYCAITTRGAEWTVRDEGDAVASPTDSDSVAGPAGRAAAEARTPPIKADMLFKFSSTGRPLAPVGSTMFDHLPAGKRAAAQAAVQALKVARRLRCVATG